MEPTAIDKRSSLNPKDGLALLVKTKTNLSKQAGQPGRDALFAGMLGDKIDQAALSGSISDPATAPGGKHPLNGINGDPESAMITDSNMLDIENPSFEEAPTLIKKSPSLTEKVELAEEEKTAIHLAKEIMEQTMAISSIGDEASHAEPSPVEKAALQIEPPYEPGAALFAQAVKPQEAACLESATDGTPARNPMAATPATSATPATPASHPDGVPQRNNGRPATDGAPAKNPMAAAPGTPATPATPASHPDGAPQRNNDRPAIDGAPARNPMAATPATSATPATPASHEQTADGAPAKNPMAATPATSATPATPASHGQTADSAPARNPIAVAPEDPVTPASHEVRPLSNRHTDHRFLREVAERPTEPVFTQQANETLHLKKGRPAIDGGLSDVHQAGFSRHDHGKRLGESKEVASVAAPQKPISAVGDGQAAPERMTPGGSPEKTLPIRDAVTETPGPAHDHQQSRNTTPNHQTKLPERDLFPFRMEMPNVVPPQETRPATAAGSAGIDMQSVIDQIVEARQASGNDFGRMRIMLNPPDLGSVDLDIIVRGERVDVVMTAENATVQQALQSRGDDIRIALQRQDLKIEGFQVLLQDNGTSQQQTNSGEMHRQNREHRERFNASEDAPPAFPAFSPITGVKSAAGLVSIFA